MTNDEIAERGRLARCVTRLGALSGELFGGAAKREGEAPALPHLLIRVSSFSRQQSLDLAWLARVVMLSCDAVTVLTRRFALCMLVAGTQDVSVMPVHDVETGTHLHFVHDCANFAQLCIGAVFRQRKN
jgi:hypothetical protein